MFFLLKLAVLVITRLLQKVVLLDYTGQIGIFKITSESGIAAGVRRIEAITAEAAERYINNQLSELESIKALFKNPSEVEKNVIAIQEENKALKAEINELMALKAGNLKDDIISNGIVVNGIKLISAKLEGLDNNTAKTLAHNIQQEVGDSIVLFGIETEGKAQLMLTISRNLTQTYNAGTIIREIAKEIQGGGGGQPFFATAGGKNPEGIDAAFEKMKEMI